MHIRWWQVANAAKVVATGGGGGGGASSEEMEEIANQMVQLTTKANDLAVRGRDMILTAHKFFRSLFLSPFPSLFLPPSLSLSLPIRLPLLNKFVQP